MAHLNDLKRIAQVEFGDIVKSIHHLDYKIRILLIDNSFIDAHLSESLLGKFGYHWECMGADGTFYRYDNFPDQKFRSIVTYPYHFHNGAQQDVVVPPFPPDIIDGFRGFMAFVKEKIRGMG
jgi:hypothetical protein